MGHPISWVTPPHGSLHPFGSPPPSQAQPVASQASIAKAFLLPVVRPETVMIEIEKHQVAALWALLSALCSRRRVGHRCSSAPLAVVPYGGVYAEGLSGRAANRRVEPHPHLPPELIALQAGGE